MYNFTFLKAGFWSGKMAVIRHPEAKSKPESGRKKASRWFALLTMAFCSALLCKGEVWAAPIISDNFDSYTAGQVLPAPWVEYYGGIIATTTFAHSGLNSAFADDGHASYATSINLSSGQQTFWFYVDDGNTAPKTIEFYDTTKSMYDPIETLYILVNESAVKLQTYSDFNWTGFTLATTTLDVWHKMELEWTDDNQLSWYLDDSLQRTATSSFTFTFLNKLMINGYSSPNLIYFDDFSGYVPPYQAATTTLDNLIDAQTSNWNFWDISYTPNDDLYDSYSAKVCYGYDESSAYCNQFNDWSYDFECDGATSTDPGFIRIPVQNYLTDQIPYYIKVYLYGNDYIDLGGGLMMCGVTDHLIASTAMITQTFTGDFYLTASGTINTSANYWDSNYGTIWGAAASSTAYTVTVGFLDTYIKPVINIINNFTGFWNASSSQDAGIATGISINLLFKTAQNINNFIPGFPLLTYIVTYFGFLIGIGLWRWGFKTSKILK